MKVVVDSDTCTGCGLCVDECPEVFEMNDDEGVAIVRPVEISEDLEASVRDAADGCPVEAISVE